MVPISYNSNEISRKATIFCIYKKDLFRVFIENGTEIDKMHCLSVDQDSNLVLGGFLHMLFYGKLSWSLGFHIRGTIRNLKATMS